VSSNEGPRITDVTNSGTNGISIIILKPDRKMWLPHVVLCRVGILYELNQKATCHVEAVGTRVGKGSMLMLRVALLREGPVLFPREKWISAGSVRQYLLAHPTNERVL
jgi:hypothetical protein